MDFSAQLDDLQQRAAQAKVDVNLAAGDAQQEANAAAASARSKWAQLRADATARMDDLQARIDKRAGQIDANVAAEDAAWAEDDAAAALDYASWTVDNARLAVLDAIDARRTRACAHSITLRGNQARLRLPPKAARAVRSPRTRPHHSPFGGHDQHEPAA